MKNKRRPRALGPEWLRWLVFLAGALVTAAYAWGDFYLPMLYIMRVDQLNAGYMARQMVFSGENPLLGMAYCALPAAAYDPLLYLGRGAEIEPCFPRFDPFAPPLRAAAPPCKNFPALL